MLPASIRERKVYRREEGTPVKSLFEAHQEHQQGAGECPVLGCRVLERQPGAMSAGAWGKGGGEKAPWIVWSALVNPVEIT